MGLFGAPDINKMKSKNNLDGLIKALAYQKDWRVRRDAAKALSKFCDPRSVEPLITVLKDKEINVITHAAETLGLIGDERAVEPLTALLCREDKEFNISNLFPPKVNHLGNYEIDENWDIKIFAAWALGRIGNSRAVEPLVDTYKQYGKQIIEEIRRIEPSQVELIITSYIEGVLELSKKVIWDPGLRKDQYHAILKLDNKVLTNYASPQALGPLITCLAIEEALSKIGVSDIDSFLPLLHDGDSIGQLVIVRVLCEVGSSQVVDLLFTSLKHKDKCLQEAIEQALLKICALNIEQLVAALDDKDSTVRLISVRVLGKIKDPQSVESLIIALKDKDQEVREAASVGLDRLGWEPSKDEADDSYWIIRYISALNHKFTNCSCYNTRKKAAESLVKLYHEGKLDEQSKTLILNQRSKIQCPHKDGAYGFHTDQGPSCSHKDYRSHVDEGIGVDFPL